MNAVRNKDGLSLVEVMVALLVLLFTSLALMQTALVSIDANTGTSMRDEAVNIADMRVNQARSTRYADIASDLDWVPENRTVRNVTVAYRSLMTVTEMVPVKQVRVEVQWDRKGITHNHIVTTLIRNPG